MCFMAVQKLLHIEMPAYVRNFPYHLTFSEAPHSQPEGKTKDLHFFLGQFHQGKGSVTGTYKL